MFYSLTYNILLELAFSDTWYVTKLDIYDIEIQTDVQNGIAKSKTAEDGSGNPVSRILQASSTQCGQQQKGV